MKAVFKNKYTEKIITHDEVKHMRADDECLGVKGWGLIFEDDTFCIVIKSCFDLVEIRA